MTIEELQKGEHETIEYKQDIPKDKDKFLKTAVAFANAAGGRLVFGVENDTWKVLGFSDEEVFQKYDAIANSIFDACTPSVVPVMEIEVIDGRKIIIANILPGMAKPYYLRKDGMMDGTYIRVAGVTRKAEPYMIKELQLAYGLKDPEIKDFGTSFRIILYRKPFETDPYGVINPAVLGEKTGGSGENPAVRKKIRRLVNLKLLRTFHWKSRSLLIA